MAVAVCTKLVEVCDMGTRASTGENIYELLDSAVSKSGSKWDNVAIGVDNENTMTGMGKGVAGHVIRTQSEVIIAGCNCHLMALAAGKAVKKLPVKFDDLLTDIYFHMVKSHKRKSPFKEIQDACGDNLNKFIKHCPTRWLSLLDCLKRLNENYEALTTFFKAEFETKVSISHY